MNRLYGVLAIFLLSGAAGLMYEIVWSRQLVLVFGNTTQAVSAILAGFFGGLAIGAIVGGRIADRVRSPLRMYGLLELALVVVVLVTPLTFGLIHEVYRGIYPTLEEAPQALALVRTILAVLALAPATVLMGATFPALTRYLARSSALSRAFGRLYAANTIGAIVGTLAAGLILIEMFGLSGALRIGAACSLVAGLAALWLARADDAAPAPAPPPEPVVVTASGAAAPATARPDPRVRLALVVAFISGLTSLALPGDVDPAPRVGDRQHDVCLHGHPRDVPDRDRPRGVAVQRLLAAHARPDPDPRRDPDPGRRARAWSGLVTVIGHPQALNPARPIETLLTLFRSIVLVVLPITIVLGIAFPTASALLRDRASESGSESGLLLGVNTMGAILASLIVPFVLMPTIGSPAVIVGLAAVNACLGIGLAVVSRPRAIPTVVAGAAMLVVVVDPGRPPGDDPPAERDAHRVARRHAVRIDRG